MDGTVNSCLQYQRAVLWKTKHWTPLKPLQTAVSNDSSWLSHQVACHVSAMLRLVPRTLLHSDNVSDHALTMLPLKLYPTLRWLQPKVGARAKSWIHTALRMRHYGHERVQIRLFTRQTLVHIDGPQCRLVADDTQVLTQRLGKYRTWWRDRPIMEQV